MAIEENFGARHLCVDYSKYQPVRTNNFEFVVDFAAANDGKGLNLYLPGRNKEDDANKINLESAGSIVRFSVVKFKPPHFSQDEIEIKRGNSKVYFAGVPTFETGDLVINDFYDADGKSVLLAWQACSYDIKNDIIPASNLYKADARVYEYLPDNTLVRSWLLHGCWVKQLTEDGWDNESAGKKVVTANIRYDWAESNSGDDF